MGWLKKAFSLNFKDSLKAWTGIDLKKNKDTAPAPTPKAPEDIGRLTTDEAQTEAQKRLARVSRYFTTVLGDPSKAVTASQKVFS